MEQSQLLRALPKVDFLVEKAQRAFMDSPYTQSQWLAATRQVIDTLRGEIQSGLCLQIPEEEGLVTLVHSALARKAQYNLRPVINATGVVLHTNLGRAPLGEKVAEHIKQVAMGYSTLEYDVESGSRGSRHSIVEELLCKLTGAQAAMAVNNNAAAVLLALAAHCQGKEVIVSRGELVEIGGSFRVPAVLEQSGALLKEVGATNKTHVYDYEKAIDLEKTGALLKVHTSNFKVVGFTQEIPAGELAPIAHRHHLPLIYDLGSGALIHPALKGFGDEPTVKEAMESGADIITFSGDKLLGGPQAGIILGSKEMIAAMKAHPLARALRIDKLTLAALEATLTLYFDPNLALKDIPTLKAIALEPPALLSRAELLYTMLTGLKTDLNITIEPMDSQVGGGSVPGQLLPSYGLCIISSLYSPQAIEEKLRNRPLPIVGRIHKGRYVMDMRTLAPDTFEEITAAFQGIFTVENTVPCQNTITCQDTVTKED